MNIPSDLLARIKRLADAEDISADQFVVRTLDDAVTYAEAANAELDAADEAMSTPHPAKGDHQSSIERACAVRAAEQTVWVQMHEAEQTRPVPLRESASLLWEQIQDGPSLYQQRTAKIEAERQENQRKLEECRRQSVEGMKRRLGIGNG